VLLNYHALVKCQSLFYLPQLSVLLNSHAQVKCQSLFYLPQLFVLLNSHAHVRYLFLYNCQIFSSTVILHHCVNHRLPTLSWNIYIERCVYNFCINFTCAPPSNTNWHSKHPFNIWWSHQTCLTMCLDCQICVWNKCIGKVWRKFEGLWLRLWC